MLYIASFCFLISELEVSDWSYMFLCFIFKTMKNAAKIITLLIPSFNIELSAK